jgi:hypothetical protein
MLPPSWIIGLERVAAIKARSIARGLGETLQLHSVILSLYQPTLVHSAASRSAVLTSASSDRTAFMSSLESEKEIENKLETLMSAINTPTQQRPTSSTPPWNGSVSNRFSQPLSIQAPLEPSTCHPPKWMANTETDRSGGLLMTLIPNRSTPKSPLVVEDEIGEAVLIDEFKDDTPPESVASSDNRVSE